jgi:hypothetical protein
MLFIDRVKRVRRAAAYVFGNNPESVRKFTSAYEPAAALSAAEGEGRGGRGPRGRGGGYGVVVC